MTPVEDLVYTIIKLHGMETLLWATIRRVEAEDCDEPYLSQLKNDLQTTLDNYRRRNDYEHHP